MNKNNKSYEKTKSAGINWTEVVKEGIHRIEPTMIFDLATRIIESKNNLEELKIKGHIFVNALKIHEETVKSYLQHHHEESMAVISALKELIQREDDKEIRKEILKQLVQYGSLSIKELKEQSQVAFQNIPKIT
jgi:hypothetical protein